MSFRLERLREERERRGLSQRQLADLCGLGEHQIYRYENGKTEPSATYLRTIANVLNVSVDYLLELTDEPRGKVGDSLTPQEQRLVSAYAAGDNATLLEMITERLRQAEGKS